MLAHGLGERADLPIPTYLLTWGAILALVVAFVLLGGAWTTPRLARSATGRPLLPYRLIQPIHVLARVVAFAIYLVCVAAAFVGFDAPDRNLLPVTLYVVLWVGGQLIGGLLGDAWAAVNPVRTLAQGSEWLARTLGRPPGGGPASWGHWPAVVGLLVFLFYELAHPSGLSPRALAWVVAVHVGATIVTGFLWGAQWVVDHEPFSVYLARLGEMAPLFDRRAEPSSADAPDHRSLGWRAPLSGLASMEVAPGTTVLLLVAIGGTAFDGFGASEFGTDLLSGLFEWKLAWAELGMLIVAISVVGALYLFGVWWAGRSTGMSFERVWDGFTPILVPVAFGFAAAHYFRLFSDESQSFWFRLSDPFGRGWDLFGGSDGLIWRVGADVVAWVQVAAIVAGHLGAVVVAHDRAIELFRGGRAIQAEMAMLAVMVAYSSLALWLLLSA